MSIQHHVQLTVNRGRVVRRRDFLKSVSLAGLAGGALGWSDLVSLKADELRSRGMSCILLWMQGGPSQFETFSPKPNHENGGETKAIATATAGIQIADNLPELAKVMNQLCVIRSMTSREGSHPRATSLLHTGYLPTASVKYPSLGALVAKELRDAQCQLPAFVQIGRNRLGSAGGGLLGVEFNPFAVNDANRPPSDVTPATETSRFRRRLGLLDKLEADFAAEGGKELVKNHRKLYDKTSKMILSPQMRTFDLADEPRLARDAYGDSSFGASCLLARRLVESGVTFVECVAGNWDTHQDNFDRNRQLTKQVDQPFAQLITDLKQRGLLDSTLVVWMGEFGRTPRINPRGGRDHYPRAFNVALAGAGVRGGQVIGETDPSGSSVSERPVSVADLFQTFCKALKIDPNKEHMSSIGRPIKIVDGGQPVDEVFA